MRWTLIKSLLIIIIAFNVPLNSRSQTASFNFQNNGSYEIRIDKDSVYTTNSFHLNYGEHLVEIWSPGIRPIVDTVLIRKDFLPRFDYVVAVDTNFVNTRNELQYFKSKRFVAKVLPIMIGVGLGVGSYIQYGRAKDQYDDLLAYSNQYESSSSSVFLNGYSSTFADKKRLYNNSRTLFYSLLTATISTAVITVFTYRLFNKNNVKPDLKKYYMSPFSGKEYSLNFNVSFNSFNLTCTI